MGKDNGQLKAAKRAYGNAKAVGNRQEEARWANVIGDILKNRGEYVEALRWLRIDYDVSVKYLPEKHLLPTCQSLGEIYLRLRHFNDALLYQKKHLELAKDANDLIEQQRASTQLGRTYHALFSSSEDDHSSLRNANKYFKLAMRLAQTLNENPPRKHSAFLEEYIDAHNNIGMLSMDLDNLEEAQKILTKGLEICDDEEVSEDDAGRGRLHHNLGSVYMELRMWDKAREHIEKDIVICKRISHCEGEAKAYINLGELHYRVQKYEDAICCYQKALDLAKSMEDEDALVQQIDQNIETVKQAMKVMEELNKEEQNFKKLTRNIVTAKGTSHERKCLMQQYASLDCLIEKSSTIFAWLKHHEFAKRKKRIASELCDKEKLSDSFAVLGESYQKLRNFKKSIKWLKKSWEMCKSIGNLEGQSSSKISKGNALDSEGDWTGALNAFEEGYRIAVEAKLPSVQLSALENMHYIHMIRFDNTEEARSLRLKIDNLKQQISGDLEQQNLERGYCSETDTEEDGPLSDGISNSSHSAELSKSFSARLDNLCDVETFDDMPLFSLLRSNKHSPNIKYSHDDVCNSPNELNGASQDCLPKTTSNQQTVARKRVRVVFSDDEDEMRDEDNSSQRSRKCPMEDVATSVRRKSNSATSASRIQDPSAIASHCYTSSCSLATIEESTCSYKSLHPKMVTPNGNFFKPSSICEVAVAPDFAVSGFKCDTDVSEKPACNRNAVNLKLHGSDSDNVQYIPFKIDNVLTHVETDSFLGVDRWHIESMKAKLACLYYLQLPIEKRSKGLLPIIHQIQCAGTVLESSLCLENLKDDLGNIEIEVSIAGWVQKRLIKLYIDSCNELSEAPNMKLLKRLYISEVEEEIEASECELQDISIIPLLNALLIHKTAATLDFSHNLLGNGTMEKLQQLFSSGQQYGALTLDLHCNRFGPTALFQICECPVLFTRLEVLNISGNHLTDACGSYLSTILENCRALYSLNMERCSITSRTIQKVAGALKAGSVLAQLCIGYNHPVSGNAITNLLAKLSALESFADLNLNGLKFNKPVIDSLCQFSKTACLSRLMLGSTGIGTDAALQLTEALCSGSQDSLKLDLSFCGLTSTYIHKLNTGIALIWGIVELNLGGNPILEEGVDVIVSLLANPQCCLKVLVLDKCQLGLDGVLQVIRALAENKHLEELHLADNANLKRKYACENNQTVQGSLHVLQQNLNTHEPSVEPCLPKEPCSGQQVLCVVNTDCNQLEVADSEDNLVREKVARPEGDDSCISSYKRNSLECEFILDLAIAIGMAKHLQLLDLSNNGFTESVAEAFYDAWSSRLGADIAWRHVKDQIVHFSVETIKCCRVSPCCRRD